MSYLLIFLSAFVLGILACPIVIFLRARKCDQWDRSNMMNIFRVIAHLATHTDDFAKFQYPDGSRPFWYLLGDAFADVVKSRPKER